MLPRALVIATVLHAVVVLSLASRRTVPPLAPADPSLDSLKLSLLPLETTGAEDSKALPSEAILPAHRGPSLAATGRARAWSRPAVARPAEADTTPDDGAADGVTVPSPLADAEPAARPTVRFTLSPEEVARSIEAESTRAPTVFGGSRGVRG